MQKRSLAEWLAWQETLHPSSIDLGLERVQIVLTRMNLPKRAAPVITVAGTKGKGSCAAMLDSIYRAAGCRAGLFTSPHLLHYNERICIEGRMATDAALCAAFERIDEARGEVSLTYFEFNALAAFVLFSDANLDLWVLEVGMGGRLDAVNAIDADVAIVTSIGLDHTEWLGNDLDSIAREKAGIARTGRPLIFGAEHMPVAISQVAEEVEARLYRCGHDFGFAVNGESWSWWWRLGSQLYSLDKLPKPGIAGEVQLFNASSALAAVKLLEGRLPIEPDAIRTGLTNARLFGRFQQYTDRDGVEWILDVAHNVMSVEVLAGHLAKLPQRFTIAVLGIMADKDLSGVLAVLREQVDVFIATALPGPRALPVEQLAKQMKAHHCELAGTAAHVTEACALAQQSAVGHTPARIVVCGSFLAVGPALQYLGLDV